MSHNPFGWSYPAGAEHDPKAPWNQEDMPEDWCDMCECQTGYIGKLWDPKDGCGSIQVCPECLEDLF